MKSRLTGLLTLAFLLLGSFTYAQQLSQKEMILRSVRESLKEKIKVENPEYWLRGQETSTDESPRLDPRIVSVIRAAAVEGQISEGGEAESEVHAAINPADTANIIISAMKQDPTSTESPLSFPTYYTTDFGLTWQQSTFNGSHPEGELVVGGGDPVIVFDSKGTAHITWLLLSANILSGDGVIGLYYATSEDKGQTWDVQTDPIIGGNITIDLLDILTGGQGIEIEDRFVDKQWLAIDRTEGPYKDNIYMAYFDVQSSPDTLLSMMVQTKKAGETVFQSERVVVSDTNFIDTQFASIDVGPTGSVHVSFWGSYDGIQYALYHAKSEDGGATFAPMNKISDLAFPGVDPATGFPESNIEGVTRLYPCPHIAVDHTDGPNSGNLYAVWTAKGVEEIVTEGFDIYFSKSIDGGASWTPAVVLNNDTNPVSQQFFSSIDVNDDGAVVVSWYDRREDTANVNTHYYLTYSKDGGDTFDEQFAVSSSPTDFNEVGSQNGGFGVGEYTQVITTRNYAIPVWADGRNNDGSVNIYIGFIDLNGGISTGLDRLHTVNSHFAINGPHPNPVQGELAFEVELHKPSNLTVSLFSSTGKLIHKTVPPLTAVGIYEHRWDVSNLASGMYFLQVNSDHGFATQKVMIR